MAYAYVTLEHPKTGELKFAPMGVSWTSLCLCPCPAIYRKDWRACAYMIPLTILTLGLSNIFFCFTYNKIYLNNLKKKGFVEKVIGASHVKRSEF